MAHAMVKKHYSAQNYRMDRIRRLRSALEDHILAIKTRIAAEIDINEPEGEEDMRRQVLEKPIFRHCLIIGKEKKLAVARPEEGWVGAGNLGSMDKTDLGCSSEDEKVPQNKKAIRNSQPCFHSLTQEHGVAQLGM